MKDPPTNMGLENDTVSRRALLRCLGVGAFSTALGAPIPFGRFLPAGIAPIALAQELDVYSLEKSGLTLLSDNPLNAETPPHLLDDKVTPNNRMFVRNNGRVPNFLPHEIDNWQLAIDGEVDEPLELSLEQLRNEFDTVTLHLQIECGGNGRRFMQPPARGNQWSFGAISCAEWTGVRLRDIFARAGLKPSASHTAHYGADLHLSGDPEKEVISRGIPISKALDPHTIIAFAVNGGDIPVLNGHPLRLVTPGWPGSCSQKWLTRIWVRDREHDGAKMGGQSYRVPRYPVAPGTPVPDTDMMVIQSMPVKSVITSPKTGNRIAVGEELSFRGHAWAGDQTVSKMEFSIDFGQTWREATLEQPTNKSSWQRWHGTQTFTQPGYYEIWARATDDRGVMQPPVQPGWNPRGYLNNLQHRIAIFTT